MSNQLEKNWAAFKEAEESLRAEHLGRIVLLHDGKIIPPIGNKGVPPASEQKYQDRVWSRDLPAELSRAAAVSLTYFERPMSEPCLSESPLWQGGGVPDGQPISCRR